MFLSCNTTSKTTPNRQAPAILRAPSFLTLLAGPALFLWSQWSAAGISQDAGEAAWANYCVSCHEGAMLEAPRKDTLALLSPESIVTTLDSGIMSSFALALDKDDMRSVAFYLTGKRDAQATFDLADSYCDSADDVQPTAPAWQGWGGDAGGRRFAATETQLTPETAKDLQLRWAFAFPGATRARAQATLSQNSVYVGSQSGAVYALDRDSGCIHWVFQADSEVRGAVRLDDNGQALYFGDFKANAYAVDTRTGTLRWKVKVHDHPLATVTGSVAADDTHVYVPVSSSEVVAASHPTYACCTFRGALVALDKRNGSLAWDYFTTAKPAPRGTNSAGAASYGPSGAPIWSSPSIDRARNSVLITTGQNYSSPATGTSDAVISLNADTGEVRWITQVTANDAWNGGCIRGGANCPAEDGPDFDIGASAVLVKNPDGKDSIYAGQKSGMTYGLDATSGELLWSHRVGRGGTMGGVHWGMSSDSERLYVGVSDQPTNNRYAQGEPAPGVQALELSSGKAIWRFMAPNRCPEQNTFLCHNGISAAVSSSPGLVFAGGMDGWFRVLDSGSGALLWEYDTARAFDTINGFEGRGGAIESDGPVIDRGQVFLSSGYDKWGEFPGNVLLMFDLADRSAQEDTP